MKKFSTDNLVRVFSKPENDYEGFKSFMYDYTHGIAVYDEDGNAVTPAQADAKINAVFFDILGLDINEKPSKKELKRAMRKHGVELMEVLEDIFEMKVATGFEENEFFNEFVEKKSIPAGDRNEFWSEKETILTVGKVSGDHHDITMQKLAEGEAFSVKTNNYAIKVGMDIDVYLLGRKSWAKLVDAVAIAFQESIQNDLFTAFVGAESELPSGGQFVVTDELVPANKEAFDQLIADVETANRSSVVILGLKTDLKKLQNLVDIDWVSPDQKREVATLGRLGAYEGTALVEIPQRFVKNDVTQKLITPGTLYILPNVDNKFVKFIEAGEIEILEVTEKGDRRDDFMTYEVQREMGISVLLDRYHGVWHIES